MSCTLVSFILHSFIRIHLRLVILTPTSIFTSFRLLGHVAIKFNDHKRSVPTGAFDIAYPGFVFLIRPLGENAVQIAFWFLLVVNYALKISRISFNTFQLNTKTYCY